MSLKQRTSILYEAGRVTRTLEQHWNTVLKKSYGILTASLGRGDRGEYKGASGLSCHRLCCSASSIMASSVISISFIEVINLLQL